MAWAHSRGRLCLGRRRKDGAGKMVGNLLQAPRALCLLLGQPVCASAAERNWSVYGQIKTTTRSRMGHTVSDKRVYCHKALHLKEKLTKAG